MVQGNALSVAIGQQVQRRRAQRGLTAAELARRARLSKATLSGLESGRGNPTIDTLDAVAQALAVPLTDILAAPESPETLLLPAVEDNGQPVQQQLVHRVQGGHQVETWRLRLAPHATVEGVPHATGTREQIVVSRGSLQAGHPDDLRHLAAGDALVFDGAVAHLYTAGADGVDATVIMTSPASA